MIGETIAYYRIVARPGKPGMGGVPEWKPGAFSIQALGAG